MSDTTVSTSSGTTTSKIPDFIKNRAEGLYGRAEGAANQGFQFYNNSANRTVQPLQQQWDALNEVNTMERNSWGRMEDPKAKLNQGVYGWQAGNERVVDEHSSLGDMADYMNPYVSNAIQPAIRDIQDAATKQRQGIDARATSAGAFGGSRQNAAMNQNREGELKAIGDLSSKAYSDAYNQAIGARQADVSRIAGLGESARNRLVEAGKASANMEDILMANSLKAQNLDYNMANQIRNIWQSQADFDFNQWKDAVNYPREQVNYLASLLQGIPYDKVSTSTQTNSQPDNSGMGLFGSLLGGLGGMFG